VHHDPIYIEEGVVHYCVPNMPSACARTASLALERAILPFLKKLSANGLDDDLKSGIQVDAGRVAHAQLARDTRRPYR
jgi:alanine dehydrogenase